MAEIEIEMREKIYGHETGLIKYTKIEFFSDTVGGFSFDEKESEDFS